MQKISFAAFIACGVGVMISPAWADSNVTIQVQNQFGAPITYQGSSCTSATCPSSFPTPIANGATSSGFTATSTNGNTGMMRVDYGAGNNVCRFTAQTSKRVGLTGCEQPTTTAFASSGQARCEVVTGQVIQDSVTCNLNATFRMLPK